jgi:ribonuclease HI
MINIYTDGACSGNPGPGSYAIAVFSKPDYVECYKQESSFHTTNNREELKGVIAALQYCYSNCNEKETYCIYTDSAYCYNIINKWIFNWYANGWKRAKNKTIENLDLIQVLYKYINTDFFKNQIIVKKVQGHNGNIGNEIADAIAVKDKRKINKFKQYLINSKVFDNF